MENGLSDFAAERGQGFLNSDYELDLAGYKIVICNSSPLRSQRSLRKNGVCFEKHNLQIIFGIETGPTFFQVIIWIALSTVS